MIAIPTLGRPVPLQWALNFKSMNPPVNFNCDFNIVFGKEIGAARQQLAEAAVARGCKYLFFLGDDVVPPPHAMRQLIYRMENHPNVDVVGGVYVAKADPPAPLVFMGNGKGSYWDWKIGEFFECTGLGMDCTLIRTDILKKMSPPWFETIDIDRHADGIASIEQWTEDLRFCKKVTDAGGHVFCDGAIICEHHDVYAKKAWVLPSDSLPMRQKGVTKDKRCLLLGSTLALNDTSFDVIRCTEEFDPSADYRVSYYDLPFERDQFDFTIVNTHILDIERLLPELKRVTKVAAKIAINLHPALSSDFALAHFKAERNGDFIEITKE